MQHHATSGFRSHLAWQVASSFAAPNKYRQKRRAELFKVQMKKANPEMLSPMTQSDLNLCTSLYTLLVRNVKGCKVYVR
jgi:hypothetical protein